MKRKTKRIVSIIMLVAYLIAGIPITTHAAGKVAEVSTYSQLVTAYNDETVDTIKLKNDITRSGSPSINARMSSITIDGSNGSGGHYKLDLDSGTSLKVGVVSPQVVIKLENLKIANTNSSMSAENFDRGFVEADHKSLVTLHFHNIETVPSTDKGYYPITISAGFGTTVIYEGNIDIKTRKQANTVGRIEIKPGTKLVHEQVDQYRSQPYSAFFFGPKSASGSPINTADRYFKVGNGANVELTRAGVAKWPAILYLYGSIDFGDNVTWYQEGYDKFLSDKSAYGSSGGKRIRFGKRNSITAVGTQNESIHFVEDGSTVEFGPGTNIIMQSAGEVFRLQGQNNSVVFRNPVGLDLISNDKVFNLNDSNSVEFKYVTLNTWKDNVNGAATAKFDKVTDVIFGTTHRSGMDVSSDNSDLNFYFTDNNSKRILTEKIEVGDLAVQYINQTGEKVGEPIKFDFDKTNLVVDEEVQIPEKFKTNPTIPADYHYATGAELNGKTQPTHAFTGMQGVNDPRITNVYIHGNSTEINVKYVNTRNTEQIVKTEKFTKVTGDKINLNTDEFKSKIPAPFIYATGEDLNEGQVQLGEVFVTPNGEYIIYVSEPKELHDAKEAAKAEIDKKATEEISKIDKNTDLTPDEKTEATEAIGKKAKDAKDNIDKATDLDNVEKEKNVSLLAIDKEAAIAAVKAAANKRNTEIDEVEGANSDDVTRAKGEVETAKTIAINAIKAAETAEAVGTAKSTGITAIENVKLPKSGLELDKEAAIREVEAKATEKNGLIEGVEGATEADVTRAKDEVEAEKNTAIGEINKATDKAGVDTAKDTGIAAIEAVKLPKSALELDKEAAIREVEAKATEKNGLIEGVEGATEADVTRAKDEVEAEKNTAIGEINKATDKAGVDTAKDTGIAAIEAVKLPKSGLDLEKDKAIAEVEAKATEKNGLIEGVEGATEADVTRAKDEVEAEKTTAIGEINKATDKAGVDTAKDTGIAAIEAVKLPKSGLDLEKDKAIAEVEAKATEKNGLIEGVEGATEADVTRAKDEVEAEKNTAIGEINKATDKAGVDTAKDTGIAAIEAVKLPKSALELDKEAAIREVEAKATEKNGLIEGVEGATEADVTRAKDEVEAEKNTAIGEINKATDKAGVDTAKDTGIAAIEAVKLPKSGLDLEKDKAIAEVEAKATEKNGLIEGVEGATEADVTRAKDEVEAEKNTAITNIKAAETSAKVTEEKDAGIKAIEDVVLPKSGLDLEKDKAIAEVEAKATEKNGLIEGVEGATEADVTRAKDEVEAEKNTAIGEINKATDKAGVDTAKDTGIAAIEAVKLPKSALELDKETAIREVEAKATEKNGLIEGVEGATEADVTRAKDEVEAEKNTAIGEINKATDKAGVDTAKDTGIAAIEAVKLPKSGLDLEKDKAIAEVEAKATEKNGLIEGVEGATEADVTRAKDEVEAEKNTAITNIKAAETSAKVTEEKDAGIKAIEDVVLPKSGLDLEKDKAIAEVEAKATEKNGLIEGVEGATEADVTRAKDEVEAEKNTAIGEINKATDKAGVDTAKDTGIAAIEAVKLPKSALELDKEAAIREVEAKATEKNGLIEGVEGATEADVTRAKDEVETAKTTAIGEINKATDKAGVDTAKDTGIAAIEAVKLPKSALELDKEAAIREVEAKATEKNGLIEGVEGATEADVTRAKDEVEAEKTTAIGEINKATDKAGVDTAKDTGIAAIEAVKLPKSALELDKEAAIREVEAKATEKNGLIEGVEGATEADVTRAKDEVEAEKNTAIGEINKATDKAGVDTAKDTGIAAIEAVKLPKSALELDKEAAIREVEAKATEKNGLIEGVEGATEADVTRAKDEVEAEKNTAIGEINKATDKAGVDTAKDTGIAAIEAVKLPKSGLDLEKEAAIREVEAKATEKDGLIDGVEGAKAEDIARAKGEVETAKTTAINAIKAAETAAKVTEEKETGIAAIEAVKLPKSGLDLEKEKAIAEIEAKAAEKDSLIDGVEGATDADITTAKEAVKAAKDAAINAIKAAETAAKVTEEKETGIAAIEDVALPKSALELDKEAAIREVEAKATEKDGLIDGVEGANAEDIARAKGEVETAKTTAIGEINKATDKAGVDTAKDTGIAAIEAVKLPKSGLDLEKEKAIKEIEAKAAAKDKAIDEVVGANAEDVNRAKGEVETEKTTAIGEINKATDKAGVDTAKDTGIAAIEAVKLPKSGLDLEKEAAIREVEAKATEKDGLIDGVEGAKAEDIARAKGEVETAKTTAINAIKAAETAAKVTEEKDAGIKAIEDVVLPKSGLDLEKDKAIAEVEAKATEKNGLIEGVEGATEADVTRAKDEVEAEKNTAITNIKAAETSAKVTEEKETGIAAIEDVALPKSALELDKEAAIREVEAKATEKDGLIDGVEGATDADIARAKGEVETAKTTAINAIKAAETAAKVTEEKETGIAAIEDVALPKSALELDKEAAIREVEAKATEKNGLIEGVEGATEADVTRAKDEVETAKTTAIGEINKATDKAGVDTAKDTGIAAIEAVKLPKSALELDKEAAIREVEAKATEKNGLIEGVEGATEADVTRAKDEVEAEKTTAIGEINKATDKAGVDTAKDTGIAAIEAVKLPKSALELDKEAAIREVEAKATEKNGLIEGVEGATEADVTRAKDEVEAEKNTAIGEINKATDKAGVDTAKDTGIAAIEAVKLPKSALELDKEAAIREVEAKATEKNGLIEGVEGATEADVTRAKDEVEAEKNTAIGEINKATDKAGVDTAKDTGIAAIEAVKLPKSGLDLEKEAAIREVEAKATEKDGLIDGVEGAKAEDIARAKGEVETAKTTAINAIKAAETAAKVTEEKETGIAAIEAVKLPKSGLDLEKEKAIAEIEAKATEKNGLIEGVEGATEADVTRAKDEVEAEKNTAITNIKAAETAAKVTEEKETGIAAIEDVALPKSALELDKEAAIREVEAKATEKDGLIDGVEGATDADIARAKGEVETAKTTAINAIKAAETAAKVTEEKETGIAAIEAVALPKSALELDKEAAIREVEAKATEKDGLIDGVEGAKAEDIARAKGEVETAKTTAINAIKAAETSAKVTEEKDAGIKAIEDVVLPKSGLDLEKDKAIAEVEAKATEKNGLIEGVEGATEADVTRAKDEVEAEKNTAITNIKAAETSAKVTEEKETGIAAIEDVALPKSALELDKEAAIREVEAKATEKNGLIEGVEGATEADVTRAKDEVEAEKNTAITNIKAAETSAKVTEEKDAGIKAIEDVVLPKSGLDLEKDKAIAEVEAKATEKNGLIEGVEGATEADVTRAKDEVETAKTTAIGEINKATDKAGVDTAKDTGIAAIEAVKLPKSALELDKEAAIREVEAKATEKNGLIEGVEGATEADVTRAKDEVEAEKNTAITNIKAAETSAKVTEEKDAGIKAIEDVVLPKSGLDLEKDKAIAEVEAKATEKNGLIEGVEGATEADVTRAKDEVEAEKNTAITNIKAAETSAKVTEEKDAGIKAIEDVVLPKSGLDLEKDKAIAEVEAKATEKNGLIEGVEGATEADVTRAKDEVEAEKNTAITNIKAAETSAKVTEEKDAGIKAIEDVVLPKSGLDLEKDKAIAEVEAKATEKNGLIEGVEGATEADVTRAKDEVEAEKNTAITNIKAAETSAKVTEEKDAGIKAIEDVVLPKSGLDLEKDKAIAEVEAKATEKNGLIEGVEGATEADVTRAKDEVEAEKNTAITNIKAAETSAKVTEEKDAGIKAIEDVVLPKSGLDLEKDKAIAEVEAKATEKNGLIEGVEGATEANVTRAKDEVEAEKNTAITNIKAAETSAKVTEEKDAGIKAIEDVVLPKTQAEELEKSKTDAKVEVDAAAKTRTDEINALTDVSADAKKAATDKVEEERVNGHTAIDNAKDAGEVEAAKNTAIDKINNVTPETPEEELADAKAKAKEDVDKAAKDKTDSITNNPDLSDKAKEEAVAKVEEERVKGNENIDNAGTVDEVGTEKDTAIENINNVTPETPEDLENAKDKAKEDVDKAAKDKTEAINNNPDLSDKAKEEAVAKVEEERVNGHTAIDNAKDAGEVEAAKNTAIDKINNVTPETPEEELADAKAKAKEDVDKAAKDKTEAINNNPDLSDKAKEEAVAKVEEERVKGNENIDNAGTVAEVGTEKDTAIENINNVTPETPEDLENAKDKAKEDVDKAAKDKTEAINNNPDLSDKAKEEAVAKVEEERVKGNENIDNAGTVAEVGKAKDTAIENINNVIPSSYEPEEPEKEHNTSGLEHIIWDWGQNDTPRNSKPEETVSNLEKVIYRSYINGYADNTIKPNGEITRGEVAAILSRLKLDQEDISYNTETKYTDVSTNDWYAKYIAFVSDNGIMNGYEDGSFKPDEKITRAEYAVALARFKNIAQSNASFTDVKGHWAEGYIGAVESEKWITGYEDGSFNPGANITRAEVATMTNRMLDRAIDATVFYGTTIKEFTDLNKGAWYYEDMVKASNTFEFER